MFFDVERANVQFDDGDVVESDWFRWLDVSPRSSAINNSDGIHFSICLFYQAAFNINVLFWLRVLIKCILCLFTGDYLRV